MPHPSESPAQAPVDAALAWPTTMRALVNHRRPLLLQGPIGGFFHQLAEVLMQQGRTVSKVNFNGGDALYWRHAGALRYTQGLAEFGPWLRQVLLGRRTDAVVLFGQMRPVHVVARQVARELGITVYVMEEGYLRPNFVTLERRGVNALSRLPRTADFYERHEVKWPTPAPQPTRQNIWRTGVLAAGYYLAANLMQPVYKCTTHHRSLNSLREFGYWWRGAARRVTCALAERGLQLQLCSEARSRRWFLVPLQVHDDSQIHHHSRFSRIEHFITEVMTSFAEHAAADLGLVIKHHPMDRAYTDYAAHIRREAKRLGLGDRVHYLHDQHLPTLLDHTLGVVTVNSTVGLQALHHGAPVITLGESVYGIPGLVYDGPLARFWSAPGEVDRSLFQRFRQHLLAHTQLNASFYADMPALSGTSGRKPLPQKASVFAGGVSGPKAM